MALARIKTWIAEILTASDLNAEFNNILNNGGGSLSSPRTANFDLDGYTCVIDADADTYFNAATDDVVDFYGQSTLLFKFDMSVSTPVNALTFTATATGLPPTITARGGDTNVGVALAPKGSGRVGIYAPFNWVDGGGTADAITCTINPGPTAWVDGYMFGVRATAANATTTPTINPTGSSGAAWGAKTIVKNSNDALIADDIDGDGYEAMFRYAADIDRVVLLNPKYPAGTSSLDLNALTTDTTGGAVGDFIPFVDVSGSNSSDKVTIRDLMYNYINNETADTAPDMAADHVLTRDNSASAPKKVLLQYIGAGKNTIWIPAGAMTSRTTNGAAIGSTESTTNKVMSRTLDFDASTAEYAQFTVTFPKSWDLGTVTAQFVWRATNTGNVVWGLQGVAISDDDATDAAFGTAQTVTDGVTATGDTMVSAATSAITIGGTPADGDLVVFQVYRDAANGSDTCAVDALLVGVKLIYTATVNTDN